jgi:hypothetical protein
MKLLRSRNSEDGFVLIAVLVVLLALLVLTAPFLETATHADQAAHQVSDRVDARLALDSATRHARANLGGSHPALDPTPYYDSLEELNTVGKLPTEVLDSNDAEGVMWEVEVADLSGKVDLDTANPMVIANLAGLVTRLRKPLTRDGKEILVHSLEPFEDSGVVWIEGERISYTGHSTEEGPALIGLSRGLGSSELEDGSFEGPGPPNGHGIGAHVIDQRAFAMNAWRTATGDGILRNLDQREQLPELQKYVLSGELGDEHMYLIDALGSVHNDVAGGPVWQRAARVTQTVEPLETWALRVDNPQWFSAGSIIQIRSELGEELRWVQRNAGTLLLDSVLELEHPAWDTEVRVLCRRPVNLNTAPSEVIEALYLGLQIVGRNDRITGGEAAELAALTIASRPFDGFGDFLRRLVLPAAQIDQLPTDAPARPAALDDEAESAVIQPIDAVALYLNGLNSNDARLAYSTMPYAFTSREVYGMELRSAVNAKSGVERASAQRDRVELIVPQEPLFTMFSRQEDFEMAVRMDRESAYWMTGPESVTRHDGRTIPPSRLIPHLGTLNGQPYVPGIGQQQLDADGEPIQPTRVLPSREDDAWAQLWPIRLPSDNQWQNRTIHFDHETRELEGRYLPDEAIRRPADDALIGWAGAGDGMLARALQSSFWIQPQSMTDSRLLDLAGLSQESDRVSLQLEGSDLVLRVLDGFGDHPGSPEIEATEARYAIAAGEGPGLPANTWSHLSIDVAGSRPDQVDLMVDGQAHGVRRLGMTRTIGPVSPTTSLIPVLSVEGFPVQGVAQIGNEMVEYVLDGDALRVSFNTEGPLAGFGGRFARLQHDVEGADVTVPLDLASGLTNGSYPDGTTVMVYGYAAPLGSNVPAGGSELPMDMGPFRVARVIDVGGDENMEPIFAGGGFVDWGGGMEGDSMPPLVLAQADFGTESTDAGDVMEAFNRNGGYAALVQLRWTAGIGADQFSAAGTPLGGIELIRYSGWSGNELNVTARGDVVQGELPSLGEINDMIGGNRAFVFDWRGGVTLNGAIIETYLRASTFCVPISVPAPGATDLDFLPPLGRSEFAQITRLDEAEMTEWVRYDEIQSTYGQLVRCEQAALLDLMNALTASGDSQGNNAEQPIPPGGGGGNLIVPPDAAKSPKAMTPPAHTASQQGQSGPTGGAWEPWLGEHEYADFPLTHAAADAFHFRGVLGTHSHAHAAGTLVLPVWRMPSGNLERGRLGAQDHVFLSSADADHPGWPLVVSRAHIPTGQRIVNGWSSNPNDGSDAQAGGTSIVNQNILFDQFVAFTTSNPEPMTPGEAPGPGGATDTRLLARVVKHPSGERPRIVGTTVIGGTATGGGGDSSSGSGAAAEVPDALIDEITFWTPQFGVGIGGAVPAYHAQGSSLLVVDELLPADLEFSVRAHSVRLPGGTAADAGNRLDAIPADGGLLRMGEEILCYESRDPETGEIRVAPLGRGLLGTTPQAHTNGQTVTWLEWIPTSVLAAPLGAGDSTISVVSTNGFPAEGTLLIGSEVIHYTRQGGSAFHMPRRSSQPGRLDGQGDGIFRGRFGTPAQGHALGAPVIWFPARYWDRYAPRADAPEMSWFGFERHQPGAFWESFFFDSDPGFQGMAQIGVLARTDPDVPWDADPDTTDGLDLYWRGRKDGQELALDRQSDHIEWRVVVRYTGGSCDPTTGRSHGWKETPRFLRLGSTCTAPGIVLRSLDR